MSVIHDVEMRSFLVTVRHDHATVFLRYGSAETERGLRHFGTLCVHSSFGTYGHHWSHMGNPLPEFLKGIYAGYLLSKISTTEPNALQTAQRMREDIIQNRRWGSYDAEEARESWNAIKELLDEVRSGREFVTLAYERSVMPVSCDWCELVASDYPEDAKAFVEQMWPAIVDQL